jgi:7-keto-8-aminopelargonate synthetase-like enzyme
MLADELLLKQGVYLQPINPPTVRPGEECLRVVVTRSHETKHILHLAMSLKKILDANHQAHRPEIQAVAAAD